MTAEEAELARTAAENATLIKGAILGGVISAFIAIVGFVVDKLYSDFWYSLSFYKPKYVQELNGTAFRVFHLQGEKKENSRVTAINLRDSFPEPDPTDGLSYSISKAILRTKRNQDALLTATLKWTSMNGSEWEGRIRGKGRYFPKVADYFNGYVYLVCDCSATSGQLHETWKVTYVLRAKKGLNGWDGFWLMVDTFDAVRAKFGVINLSIA